MSNEQIINILINNGKYLVEKDFLEEYLLRPLLYRLLKIAKTIADTFYNIFTKALSFNIFFNSAGINNAYDKLKILVAVLMGLSIIFILYSIQFKGDEKKPNVLSNFIMSIALIVMIPTVMSTSEITNASMKALDSLNITNSSDNSGNMIDNVYRNLFVDITPYNQNNFNTNIIPNGSHGLSSDELNRLNMSEYVDSPKSVLKHKLQGKDLMPMPKGNFFSLYKVGYYYRWYIDFLPGIIFLLIIAYTFFRMTIKVAKIIYELGINKIFLMVVAPLDLSSGKRTKLVLKEIMNGFFSLIGCYGLGLTFSAFSTFVISLDVNFWLKIAFMIGAGLVTVKGSQAFEKVLGIDTHLKDNLLPSIQTVQALRMGGAFTKGILSSGIGAVSSGMSKISSFRDNLTSSATNNSENNSSGFSSGYNENINNSNYNNNSASSSYSGNNSSGFSSGYNENLNNSNYNNSSVGNSPSGNNSNINFDKYNQNKTNL